MPAKVYDNVIVKECKASAHQPGGWTENYCPCCMPWWHLYPACPDCNAKLEYGYTTKTHKCPKCKKRYYKHGTKQLQDLFAEQQKGR